MNETLEKLIELSTAAKGAILAVVGLSVFGLYYVSSYSTVLEEIETLRNETKKLQVDVEEKQRIAANLPQFEAEVERLDIELNKALAELPDKKEIPALLEKVADKAKESVLDIKLFKPRSEQKKDFYAEVPVEIEVAGDYHQIASFFDEVGHLERIVNVDQISLIAPKVVTEQVILNAALVATSFRFLDESERPKDDAKKSKKRRKSSSSSKGE